MQSSLVFFLRTSLPFFAFLMMHLRRNSFRHVNDDSGRRSNWLPFSHLAWSCSGEASGHHFTLPLVRFALEGKARKTPPTRHGTSLRLLGHGVRVRVRVRVPGRRARAGLDPRVGDVDVAAVAGQPF